MDAIISCCEHPPEGQWHTDTWQDVSIAGNEALGAAIVQRRNIGFKARSAVIFNTSDLRFKMDGGIIIPPVSSEFVARVKPPRDVFSVFVDKAGGAAGELRVFLTEELLRPTWAQL